MYSYCMSSFLFLLNPWSQPLVSQADELAGLAPPEVFVFQSHVANRNKLPETALRV